MKNTYVGDLKDKLSCKVNIKSGRRIVKLSEAVNFLYKNNIQIKRT